jgi:hypothetical protein
VSGQSFLEERHATLSSAGPGWALRYEVASYEYGSRLEESVDCEIAIAPARYEDALALVEMILRGHVAPRVPELQLPLWTPPALPTGWHMFLGRKAA